MTYIPRHNIVTYFDLEYLSLKLACPGWPVSYRGTSFLSIKPQRSRGRRRQCADSGSATGRSVQTCLPRPEGPAFGRLCPVCRLLPSMAARPPARLRGAKRENRESLLSTLMSICDRRNCCRLILLTKYGNQTRLVLSGFFACL